MERIREMIQADPELSRRIKMIADNPPPLSCGKDYNELLQRKSAELKKENARTVQRGGMER